MADNTNTPPTVEQLQAQLAELTQKMERANQAYRELQSRTDRERDQYQRQLADAQAEAKAQMEELLKAVDAHPELKSNLEQTQMRVKAQRWDRMQQQQDELERAKESYAQAFGVEVEAMAGATTAMEAFALARQAEKQKMFEEFKQQLGLSETKAKESEDAPPAVPASRGPTPNAGQMSDVDWQRQLDELAERARNVQLPKKERDQARHQWLVLQGQRPRGSRRTRV